MDHKRVAFTTLGCKVNQYESAALEELFRRRGYQVVDYNQPADIYIINTCTVTHLGDRKSRQLIRRATRTNPEAVVAVTGCYAQTAPDEVLGIEGVDLVIGAGNRAGIVDLVEGTVKGRQTVAVRDISEDREFEELPGETNQGRVRAFLKIQEGCQNFCSYCIVPYARGPLRSRTPENVLAGAAELLARGFREIVLTGIHTGAYGREPGGSIGLAELLEKLAILPGLLRLRLSSLEPHDVTPKILELLSSGPPFCRHLHIPLQSGDDEILKSMRRTYDTSYFRRLTARIREKIPDCGITTDVMVGFPGETDRHFNNTLEFIAEMQFSGLHVFKYSPRRGTPAANFPEQVAPAAKETRSRRLIALGREMTNRFAATYLGQTVDVLAEQLISADKGGQLEGLTENYLRVTFAGSPEVLGKQIRVSITEINDTVLNARII
ncbi:MAG TPA: tRNA (N(6)-L-threonylcarbamoyladenosine(37)-C(2))-methylthiotransferase MtaB [Desulfotomaculum sp.]|nr:MAG: RNA modification enzyme MiaB [Desulfotomaculum sp. BICA1-6]HBX22827.1 tRNA (N(6)-L-threonylcarbamoyladenosine(37)-C(2))-methylthiotransferase MtaB [Desulfotomaculum sp.]